MKDQLKKGVKNIKAKEKEDFDELYDNIKDKEGVKVM